MFRHFCTIFISALILTSAQAQDTIRPSNVKIFGGIRLGGGMANQTNTIRNDEGSGFKMVPVMGAFVRFDFNSSLSLLTELHYAGKGYSFKSNIGDTSFYSRNYLHSIDLPILLMARIGNAKFSEFFEIGIVGSYIAGGYRYDFSEVNGNTLQENYQTWVFNKPIPAPLKRMDVSILGGLGVGFRAGKGRMNVGLRYQIGLLDIYKSQRFDFVESKSQKQRNLYLHLAYYLPLKK